MLDKKHWKWLISGLLLFSVTLVSLCFGNNNSNDNEYTPTTSDLELDVLYLGTSYLLPEPPGAKITNKTELFAKNQTIFGHNIRDRKFNDNIKPELNLWLDAYGKEGIELEFEIIFKAVEDNTEIPDKTYKILFGNYTTIITNDTGPQNLNLSYLAYEGNPFDIKSGSENWGTIHFVIRRIDNQTDSKLDIYCGADEKISYIRLPYDQTLSAYDYEREKDKQKTSTPNFTGELFVIAISLFLAYSIFNPSRKRSR